MYFVLLAAAVAILTGVVAVAMGWGGEMAPAGRDRPEAPVRARTASDVAMLRLPLGLLGYQQEATDAALHVIAGLVARRDAEIADLRDELRRLRAQAAAAARSGPDGGRDPVAPAGQHDSTGRLDVRGQRDSAGREEAGQQDGTGTDDDAAQDDDAAVPGGQAGEVLSGQGRAAGQHPHPA